MTKSEMESLLQQEVKGLTNYLASPDFSNAVMMPPERQGSHLLYLLISRFSGLKIERKGICSFTSLPSPLINSSMNKLTCSTVLSTTED